MGSKTGFVEKITTIEVWVGSVQNKFVNL